MTDTSLTLIKQETDIDTIKRIFNTPDRKHKIKRAHHALTKGYKYGHNLAIAKIAIAMDLPVGLVQGVVENPRTKTIYQIITKELQWVGEIE